MKASPTFSCLRSINNQYHNKLSQEDQYQLYLKRIEKIVERKPLRDASPEHNMKFLHKIKQKSRDHRDAEDNSKINLENKYLLQKIVQNKARKMQTSSSTYHYQVAVHEKRFREIERINQQNRRMANRISGQNSILRKTLLSQKHSSAIRDASRVNKVGSSRQSALNEKGGKQNITTYAGWNYSPLKNRKLPKLVTKLNNSKAFQSNDRSSLLESTE